MCQARFDFDRRRCYLLGLNSSSTLASGKPIATQQGLSTRCWPVPATGSAVAGGPRIGLGAGDFVWALVPASVLVRIGNRAGPEVSWHRARCRLRSRRGAWIGLGPLVDGGRVPAAVLRALGVSEDG